MPVDISSGSMVEGVIFILEISESKLRMRHVIFEEFIPVLQQFGVSYVFDSFGRVLI